MADVLDGNPELPRPKKWHRIEALTASENVPGGGLSLTLGNDPVFNPNELLGANIGPARDVARGKDARHTRFEVFIHHNASIDLESSLLGEHHRRAHSHAQDQEIGLDGAATLQNCLSPLEPSHGVLQVKDYAVGLVQAAYE